MITATTVLQTAFGRFRVRYHRTTYGDGVSLSRGCLSRGTPLVRLHSACLFGEVFSSSHCDCHNQFTEALHLIRKSGTGVIVYTYQEGRGIGLEEKIRAMEIQRRDHCDTVDAFAKLGYPPDLRTYKREMEILGDLEMSRLIRLISCNPSKIKVLSIAGYTVIEHLETGTRHLGLLARKELAVKKQRLGYCIHTLSGDNHPDSTERKGGS